MSLKAALCVYARNVRNVAGESAIAESRKEPFWAVSLSIRETIDFSADSEKILLLGTGIARSHQGNECMTKIV